MYLLYLIEKLVSDGSDLLFCERALDICKHVQIASALTQKISPRIANMILPLVKVCVKGALNRLEHIKQLFQSLVLHELTSVETKPLYQDWMAPACCVLFHQDGSFSFATECAEIDPVEFVLIEQVLAKL